MIKFDNSPASFKPPSLNFEHDYAGALLIFDDAVWDEIAKDDKLGAVRSKTGRVYENFREYQQDILLVYPNAGAPAAVIDFELLIASGVRRFVAFGTCGVFDPNIPQNSIVVPTIAIREEGTSYHYLPADEDLEFPNGLVEKMSKCAQDYNITTSIGGIWTTDAVYRETETKIGNMEEAGCIGVDMELSALMAVAQYRDVKFAQFLIADDLVPPRPVSRKIDERNNQKYINLALDILKIF